jgi:HSP20 family protein
MDAMMKWEGPRGVDLWDAFDGMRGDLDRALDLFRVPEAAGLFDRDRAPAIDLVEDAEGYRIVADLPGVDRKDLEVSMTGSLLTIKGEKKADMDSGKRKFFRRETWVGSFMRTIDLPSDVDPEKVSAELKDGVLSVRIAKREEAKPRLVSVSVR